MIAAVFTSRNPTSFTFDGLTARRRILRASPGVVDETHGGHRVSFALKTPSCLCAERAIVLRLTLNERT